MVKRAQFDWSAKIQKDSGDVFESVAARNGLSVTEVARLVFPSLATEHFGTMPENYDPSQDPDHPSKGFRVDR